MRWKFEKRDRLLYTSPFFSDSSEGLGFPTEDPGNEIFFLKGKVGATESNSRNHAFQQSPGPAGNVQSRLDLVADDPLFEFCF